MHAKLVVKVFKQLIELWILTSASTWCARMLSWPSIAWAFAQILYNTGPYYFCIFLDSDTPPKCASWKRQRGMRNCRTRIRGLSCPGHHGIGRGICSIDGGERRVGDAARMGDDVPSGSRHLDSTGIAGGGVASHSRHPVIAVAVVWETCGGSSGSAIRTVV